MTENTIKELDLITTHPTDFLRVVNTRMVNKLRSNSSAKLSVPSLMERAKTFVHQDRYSYIVVEMEKEE